VDRPSGEVIAGNTLFKAASTEVPFACSTAAVTSRPSR
jgi:hypothetical protein